MMCAASDNADAQQIGVPSFICCVLVIPAIFFFVGNILFLVASGYFDFSGIVFGLPQMEIEIPDLPTVCQASMALVIMAIILDVIGFVLSCFGAVGSSGGFAKVVPSS